jgi:hypothetical protein
VIYICTVAIYYGSIVFEEVVLAQSKVTAMRISTLPWWKV